MVIVNLNLVLIIGFLFSSTCCNMFHLVAFKICYNRDSLLFHLFVINIYGSSHCKVLLEINLNQKN